jgi:hypothetical protein
MTGGVDTEPLKKYLLPMSDYQCPKCGGTIYFIAKRNVSGVVFARLTTRNVPVCKKCDEIMASTLKLNPIIPKILIGALVAFLVLSVFGALFL